jgi:hypothetical protein
MTIIEDLGSALSRSRVLELFWDVEESDMELWGEGLRIIVPVVP